jgi:hypothetical protein
MGDQKIQISACILAPSVGPTRRHLVCDSEWDLAKQGFTQEMSPIFADQIATSYMSPNRGRGGGGGCGASANEYSCEHEAQINIGDLTPYLTYVAKVTCTRSKFFIRNFGFAVKAPKDDLE